MMVGAFQFYNYRVGRCGEVFGLCKAHEAEVKKSPPPFITQGDGYMRKIANDSELSCNECDAVSERESRAGEKS